MKYDRDYAFKYTGIDSIPSTWNTDSYSFDGSNLICDNMCANIGDLVGYNIEDGNPKDVLIIESLHEYITKNIITDEFKEIAEEAEEGGGGKGTVINISLNNPSGVVQTTLVCDWVTEGIDQAIINAVADKENKDITVNIDLGPSAQEYVGQFNEINLRNSFNGLSNYEGTITINRNVGDNIELLISVTSDDIFTFGRHIDMDNTFNISHRNDINNTLVTLVNYNPSYDFFVEAKAVDVKPYDWIDYEFYINNDTKEANINIDDIINSKNGDLQFNIIFTNIICDDALIIYLPNVDSSKLLDSTVYRVQQYSFDSSESFYGPNTLYQSTEPLYYDGPMGASYSKVQDEFEWSAY